MKIFENLFGKTAGRVTKVTTIAAGIYIIAMIVLGIIN